MNVTLLALGGGPSGTWTEQTYNALTRAQYIIGAVRLLNALPAQCTAHRAAATHPTEILALLQQADWDRAAVVYSGDTGFYSGARLLLPLLEENGFDAQVLPGISSVQLLAARLGHPWQDWTLVSAHGVHCDPVAAVMEGRPAFFLTGGAFGPAELCRQLTGAGLGDLTVTVGENLACPDERIFTGTAAACACRAFAPLSVLLAEAAPVMPRRTPGWPDDWFIRGQTPMTKQEVRTTALAKLGITPGEVCWDIGAGTGSVSVELAAVGGPVYAVECEADACQLIRQNREKFHAWNLTLVEGRAPEALDTLPPPDAVFIGGSKGELPLILDAVFAKNPAARVCVTAIALETLHTAVEALTAHGIEAEITQLAVSKTRTAGKLHLLLANNPVFLITGNCL